MKVWITASGIAALGMLTVACAGTGPMGEPAKGVQGLKNAAARSESEKTTSALTPRGGGSAIAPTGPDGAPTAGPTDAIGPQ